MSSNEPPPLGARERQKAATRESLLAAARRCFEARGFSGTVVADIVREAGVAHGTFYVHFSSVAAAADALLEGFNTSLASRLGPLLLEAAPLSQEVEGAALEAVVRRAAGLFLDALDDDRALVGFYAERASSGLPREALATGINPPALAAITEALVRRGEQGGASASARARLDLVAHGLLALWLRVGLRYALLEGVRRSDALAVLVSLTTGALSGLSAPPAARAPSPPPPRRRSPRDATTSSPQSTKRSTRRGPRS